MYLDIGRISKSYTEKSHTTDFPVVQVKTNYTTPEVDVTRTELFALFLLAFTFSATS